jgi:hypothetical protein
MRSDATARIDHRDLTHIASAILREQILQRVWSGCAASHQVEPALAVARIDERLRRHRSDAGFRPGHHGADVEPMRLHRDAELTGRRISRHDRIRMNRPRGDRRPFLRRADRRARQCDETSDSVHSE